MIIRADNPITSGTFVLSYGKERTNPMPFNATSNGTEASMQAKLNALPNVEGIIISREGNNTETQRYSWGITVPTDTSQHVVLPKWRRREIQKIACSVPPPVGTALPRTGFGVIWGTGSTTEYFEVGINAYERDVAYILESFDYIRNVTVKFFYLGEDGTSEDITICTQGGTMTYVSFDEVFTLGPNESTPGDLEPLVVDRLNTKGSKLGPMPAAASIWTEFKEVQKGIDSCRHPEIQSGFCVAQGGRLSISLDGANGITQTVLDIPYDASTDALKNLLENGLNYVREVSVSYSDGTTVCSKDNTKINTITIIFVWMNTVKGTGDIEPIKLDRTNKGKSGLTCDTCQLRYSPSFKEERKGKQCEPISESYTKDPSNQMRTSVISEMGSFELTFRGFTTQPIDSNAPPEAVKSILEGLPSLIDVDIEFSGTHACESVS
jgi:hypothetical protein